MADWLRAWTRLLASEVDDLLRRAVGIGKVDFLGELAVLDLEEQFLSELFPNNGRRARGFGEFCSSPKVCVDMCFLMEPVSVAYNRQMLL